MNTWDQLRALALKLGDMDVSDANETGDAIDEVVGHLRRISDELEEEDLLRDEIALAPPLIAPDETDD